MAGGRIWGMKNMLYTIILSFLFSSSVFADLEAGVNAVKAGDYETAYKEFKAAAEQGDVAAQSDLGKLYYRGKGVAQDYKEAAKWFRLAAEQGYVKAQFNLALLHKRGKGVTQDYKEAAKWYRLAAEQGDVKGQYSLGVMNAQGKGVIQNVVLAHMWFNIAVSIGDKQVMEFAKENRDFAESKMTPEQLAKAQELARECIEKNYKDCG